MVLTKSYSSSIEDLLDLFNQETIFLSDWNKKDKSIDFSYDLSVQWTVESTDKISNYLFSDEFLSLKQKIFSDNEELLNVGLNPNKMAIVSNGTIASFLCLYELIQKSNLKAALLITPVYYTYINVLKDADIAIYFEQYDKIIESSFEKYENKNIGLIILNFPLYGIGINLDSDKLNYLINFANKSSIYILADNLYGGLYWNKNNKIFDYDLLKKILSAEKYMYIDSLSKKLYLNGSKHCYIFANPDKINSIEKDSVYIAGSLSATQHHFIEELYCIENRDYIEQCLANIVSEAKQNYDFLISICLSNKCILLPCQNGFFCLCGLPVANLNKASDTTELSKQILGKCNVLTLPHDRYLLFSEEYYFFRINLLNKANVYHKAFSLLQETFNLRN